MRTNNNDIGGELVKAELLEQNGLLFFSESLRQLPVHLILVVEESGIRQTKVNFRSVIFPKISLLQEFDVFMIAEHVVDQEDRVAESHKKHQ